MWYFEYPVLKTDILRYFGSHILEENFWFVSDSKTKKTNWIFDLLDQIDQMTNWIHRVKYLWTLLAHEPSICNNLWCSLLLVPKICNN